MFLVSFSLDFSLSLNTGLYLHEMTKINFIVKQSGLWGTKEKLYRRAYRRVRLLFSWAAFLSSAESFIISADNPSDLLCSLISWSYKKTICVTVKWWHDYYKNRPHAIQRRAEELACLTFRERFSLTNSGALEMLFSFWPSGWILILLDFNFNKLACSTLVSPSENGALHVASNIL
jgi:hypothetical protein